MRIETKTDNRKKMVQDIAEFTGRELRYVGPPTFAYEVGSLTIDRDGVITSETDEVENFLLQFLQEKGYLEAPVDEVRIVIPADTNDRTFLQNLLTMIHARAYLLNRITRCETFAVSDSLLKKLEHLPQENACETFQTFLSEDTGDLKGLAVRQYRNYHFEEEVQEHEVLFHYLLKKGKATSRNAIKLLSMLEYDPVIVKGAEEAAADFEQTGVWKPCVKEGR